MDVRSCRESDLKTVVALVDKCGTFLVRHTDFTYIVLFRYFGDLCFVLEDDGEAVGFATAVRSSDRPDTVYLWQIGMVPECQGRGLSALLIDRVVQQTRKLGCMRLEFSVDRTNEKSRGAFESYAGKNGIRMERGEALRFDKTDGSGTVTDDHFAYVLSAGTVSGKS
jgi:L-2,4-diaminobutyric acid acetyltransferase